MSAVQVAGGKLLQFPGGDHFAPELPAEKLTAQALEWHRIAQMHHFNARIAMARGDFGAAANELVHEHGKVLQALAIMKELRGLPLGKRALELQALQLVLSAVNDELAFLPGVTAEDTADYLRDARSVVIVPIAADRMSAISCAVRTKKSSS